jgi:hypothetical protein
MEYLLVYEKAAVITKFNIKVLDKLSGMQEELLKWNKYIRNRELLGLSSEELKVY